MHIHVFRLISNTKLDGYTQIYVCISFYVNRIAYHCWHHKLVGRETGSVDCALHVVHRTTKKTSKIHTVYNACGITVANFSLDPKQIQSNKKPTHLIEFLFWAFFVENDNYFFFVIAVWLYTVCSVCEANIWLCFICMSGIIRVLHLNTTIQCGMQRFAKLLAAIVCWQEITQQRVEREKNCVYLYKLTIRYDMTAFARIVCRLMCVCVFFFCCFNITISTTVCPMPIQCAQLDVLTFGKFNFDSRIRMQFIKSLQFGNIKKKQSENIQMWANLFRNEFL